MLILFLGENTNRSHPYHKKEIDLTKPSLSNSGSFIYEWYLTWGGSARDVCYDFIMDSSGNYYLVGETWSYGDPNSADIGLVKFNSNGEYQWHRIWGSSGHDQGRALSLDSSENIYVGGWTGQNTDYCFLKYDPSGNLLLSRTWGGAKGDYCFSIEIDTENNIYLGGKTDSYGNGVPGDMCLVKFNSSGDYQWYQLWGGTSSEFCYDVVLDSVKNIYIAGYTGSVSESNSACVIKFNESGDFLWYRTWNAGHPSMFSSRFQAVTVDMYDNIYLTGRSQRFGYDDVCIIKYNSAGDLQWDRTWSGSVTDEGYDISILNNDVFVGGFTGDYHDGNRQICLLKYNNIGNFEWVKTWGGSTTEECYSLKFNKFDDLYIAGKTASYGLGNYDYCVIKFNTPPKIDIFSPSSNQNFGLNAPGYNLSILDYEFSWYNLNNGLNHNFIDFYGQLDQVAWDLCDNGTVLITFYANDSVGALRQTEISVLKDAFVPQIIIQKPVPYKIYGNTTFEYELTIIEENLDSSWYNLNDGYNYTFTGNFGMLDQDLWEEQGNGTTLLRFYANDTSSNLGFEDILIYKDVLLPEIIIESPLNGQVYRNIAPKFNLSIYDADLNYSWYEFNNNGSKYYFSEPNGTIDQTAWDLLQNGTVLISFYANNSVGNLARRDVLLHKDIALPIVYINSPHEHQIFGAPSLWFNLTIIEGNLDSMWYSLNDDLNISFTGTTGTIAQSEWDKCENGSVIIRFYVNDSLGNFAFEEIIVNKDIFIPEITINNPITLQLVGKNAFKYNITVLEPNLDKIWYTLNDSSYQNIIFDTLGHIDQGIWDLFGSGTIRVKFYANDSAGNISFEEVIVTKDSDQIIQSDLYNISPISIDPTGSRGVPWSEIVLNEWCSGSGTQSNPYIIEYVSIQTDTSGSCLEIYNSNKYFIIRYCSFSYATRGYPFISDYSAGIKLHNTNHGQLIENICHHNLVGILVEDGNYNLFQKNQISNNYYGIHLEGDYNNIIENDIYDNVQCGIKLEDTLGCIIEKNLVNSNGYCGIYLTNTASSSSIRHNVINSNDDYGIYIYYGANNIAYNNTFSENGINAADDGDTNVWDNGVLGNYWDDYQGKDTNDNGIGDTPYTDITGVGGSEDNYPIWWDPPHIFVTLPINFSMSDSESPTYSISVDEGFTSSLWYSINDGTNIALSSMTGAIDQTEWNNILDGEVHIKFYSNDSRNYISFSEVILIKDTLKPNISIIFPLQNDDFGINTIDFKLEYNEPNLHTTWYSLNGGLNFTFSGTSGTIDKPAWDNVGDGAVSIRFYANDSLNHVSFEEVVVVKHTNIPNITILSPDVNKIFGEEMLYFEIVVDTSDINSTWYSLNHGKSVLFTGLMGFIDENEWDNQGNGTILITFYVNNTWGNIGFSEVIVRKDVIAPNVIINFPIKNQFYGKTAPTFNITIIEANLRDIWYTLDGGVTNMTLFSSTGMISQTEWDKIVNGSIILRFYANDSLGNLNFSEMVLMKDVFSPVITINSPTNFELFGNIPLIFNISVLEPNLKEIWYTLDNGLTNISIIDLFEAINLLEWNKLGNGTVNIRFYVLDKAKNIGFEDVIIRKDVTNPILNVLNPISNNFYSNEAPYFEVTVDEPNLDTILYTLDDGLTNITITSLSDKIEQAEWDKLPNGQIKIYFYANDSVGNIILTELFLIKDTINPIIAIQEPTLNQEFSLPPSFIINIDEENYESCWYSLDQGMNNYTITYLSGMIEQSIWDTTLDGEVVIQFYAIDKSGNIGTAFATVLKISPQQITSPPGIPGYQLIVLIGISILITIFSIKRKFNNL